MNVVVQYHLPKAMTLWESVANARIIQNFMMRRKKMKDNFHIGFIVGMITALFMAIVVSCTMTPLEANSSEIGSSSWNPMYVKIVD